MLFVHRKDLFHLGLRRLNCSCQRAFAFLLHQGYDADPNAIEQGDPHAAEQLLPLVYDDVRRIAAHMVAQEKPGQTLQATALVHEAYVRLSGAGEKLPAWDGRGHFFAAAGGGHAWNSGRERPAQKEREAWRRPETP